MYFYNYPFCLDEDVVEIDLLFYFILFSERGRALDVLAALLSLDTSLK